VTSDAILAAARESCQPLPDADPKNAQNLAVLIALLDSTQAIAQAIYDNAVDDNLPIDQQLATQLCAQSWNIARVIVEAAEQRTSAPLI
jgi:hypothetical protein